MPGSIRENDDDLKVFVIDKHIKKVLDVGTGKGTYAQLLGKYIDQIDGIEVWEPYIDAFNLRDKYDNLIIGDARYMDLHYFRGYDLVIFGDVLEHMTEGESLSLWHKAEEAGCRFGMISVPVIHYPQGPEFGNPFEIHVQEHLTPEHIRETYGPFVEDWVYEVTGTFIKEFN